jgi:hypothetical protein
MATLQSPRAKGVTLPDVAGRKGARERVHGARRCHA